MSDSCAARICLFSTALLVSLTSLAETPNKLAYTLTADSEPITIDLAKGLDDVTRVTLQMNKIDDAPEVDIQKNVLDLAGFAFDANNHTISITPDAYKGSLQPGEKKTLAVDYTVEQKDKPPTLRRLTVMIEGAREEQGVSNGQDLCSNQHGFGGQPKFCYNLLVGAEGTSVQNLNSKANIRSEFIAYQTLEIRKYGMPDVHVWGNMLFTSTGETSSTGDQSTAGPQPSTTDKQSTAVEGNINLGLFTRGALDNADLKFGWIAYSGVRKDVDGSEFAKRYYSGLSLRRNPNQYIDVLYGKTEGVSGQRLEFRAQIPVGKVFLGMVLNHSVSNGPPKGEGTDFVKLYFLAPVDVTSIFTSIAK